MFKSVATMSKFSQHCSSFLSFLIILMVEHNYFQICI